MQSGYVCATTARLLKNPGHKWHILEENVPKIPECGTLPSKNNVPLMARTLVFFYKNAAHQ